MLEVLELEIGNQSYFSSLVQKILWIDSFVCKDVSILSYLFNDFRDDVPVFICVEFKTAFEHIIDDVGYT